MARKGGSEHRSIRPVAVRTQELPLLDSDFTWERFEEFCAAFIAKLPGVKRVTKYGKKGSKQQGIVLIAEMDSGETWSFQCRHWKQFSARQFARTVTENTFGA